MKKTKKAWALFIGQALFMIVIPCLFIWLQYGDLGTRYKISVTAIFLLILVFWTAKKIMFSNYLKTLDQKIVNIETNALSIVDKSAIEENKKAWRRFSLIKLFMNGVVPVLLFILGLITIKVVEDGLIKLYGCLIFCLLSIIMGVFLKIAEIYSMSLVP